ncbi:MAG TPA: twin-arginine translocation signal domain-containing protein, partial [Ktedonobacteraceae bacterium]
MLQQRTSEQIRIDALKMGIKKAQEGCLSCAYGYFTLAKQHGASDEEIQQAVNKAIKTGQHNIQRRDVLKMIASGGLAAAAGGLAIGT